MTTYHQPFVTLDMSRHDAKELLALLKTDKTLANSSRKRLCKELREGLKTWYIYTVKCSDCSNTWEHRTQKKLTDKEPIQGGCCVQCSVIYK
jgi:hypothetical protein